MHRFTTPILIITGLALAGCSGGVSTAPTPTPPGQTTQAEETTQSTATSTEPAAEPAAPQPQELTFPDEAFRATQPGPGTPRDLQIPTIDTFKLKNGIQVYLVKRDDLPVVSLELNFDGGSMNDPKGKEGLAGVCMSMLNEGSTKLSKTAYDEALADIASRVSSYAGRESQGVSMSTLTKHFDKTYELYLQAIFEPAFAEKDFQRVVQQRLEGLKQQKGDPAGVARRVADKVLYGPDHPFGRVETETSLAAITIDDCKQYVTDYLKPKGARLFVVGKMDEEQIRAKLGVAALPAWKGAGKKSVKLPKPRPMKGKVFFVDVPGAEQSQLQFMHFGPLRKARDYFETSMASAIAGGGFSSRLNMNLREDKGYSYGARGGFNYTRDYGEFSAGSSVRGDASWQSLMEVYNEIDALQSGAKPATEEELTREKNGAILGLPGRFATMSEVLGAYRSLVYFGLPLDYYTSYVDKVRAITLKQVNAAAKKHLKPKQSVVLVVGDSSAAQKERVDGKDVPMAGADGAPVTLRAGLDSLVGKNVFGKGSLVELDTDGNPKK
ncbi:MAG TPA: pitrilysin family protein [Kofleriaceae bacterium]|nr:pitrilysin family protein [Kofleriaceae bacterium]